MIQIIEIVYQSNSNDHSYQFHQNQRVKGAMDAACLQGFHYMHKIHKYPLQIQHSNAVSAILRSALTTACFSFSVFFGFLSLPLHIYTLGNDLRMISKQIMSFICNMYVQPQKPYALFSKLQI